MDFSLPPVGEGLIEVELVRWLVRPGDAVAPGQGLAEVMSDKATMEVPAPFAGTVSGLAAQPGTKVQVGQVVLSYTPAAGAEVRGQRSEVREQRQESAGLTSDLRPLTSGSPASNGRNGPVVASPGKLPAAAPSVRLLARKLGIDLAAVRGSGPHGRILL